MTVIFRSCFLKSIRQNELFSKKHVKIRFFKIYLTSIKQPPKIIESSAKGTLEIAIARYYFYLVEGTVGPL